MPTDARPLDLPTLEQWLWNAACRIRGALDAPKFKDYILPLIFLKRLSDVFDGEIARLGDEFGDHQVASAFAEQDRSLVRFYIPQPARWTSIAARTTGMGEYLTDALRAVERENPRLAGVFGAFDFNATTAGQRIIDDDRLRDLIGVLGQYRLRLDDVEPDILGRAYEYLLRKFAEGQGQSAGEYYTPPEVTILLARILDPQPGMTVYDPCCGSGGLLIKCHLRLLETHGVRENGRLRLPADDAPLQLFGQETNASTYAMARMNAFLHDMEAAIAYGDTMARPAFTSGDGALGHFDLVTANPMWNQDFSVATYQHDTYERFQFGAPPGSSADWGWLEHMVASLKPGGKMAVVLDTGAVSRGSGNTGSNRERDIRRLFIEPSLVSTGDLIEAVVLLPENLFYNTTAPGIIVVVNKHKPHPGEILLINGKRHFSKGRPKNYLTEEHVAHIAELYHTWQAEKGVSAIITGAEAAKQDYNLSPSRYVSSSEQEEVLPLEEAVVLLREAEEERAEADRELWEVLTRLGIPKSPYE